MAYSFYIEISSVYTKFNPFFDNCSLQATLDSNIRKIEKFNGELIFKGNEFLILRTLFLSGINSLNIKIYKGLVLEFTGFLNLRGTYNIKEFQAKLKITENNKYHNIEKNKDKVYNAFDFDITKKTVTLIYKSVELVRYSMYSDGRNLPFWIIVPNAYYMDHVGTISISAGKVRHTWVYPVFNINYDMSLPYLFEVYQYLQEIVSDETTLSELEYKAAHPLEFPLGVDKYTYYHTFDGNVITILHKFTKNVSNSNMALIDPSVSVNFIKEDFEDRYISLVIPQTVITKSYTFFLKFYDILEKLLLTIDPTILINESTYCNYFNPNYDFLFVAQKSDVLRPDASQPATVLSVSFKRLMELCKNMFNLDWHIDNTNTFKFIHPSENILSVVDIDLTSTKYDNLQEYNAKEIENYNKQIWTFEQSKNISFSTAEIQFDNEETSNENFASEDVNNNITEIINNTGFSDDGFVFVATNSLNEIINGISPSSPENVELSNINMSASFLVENNFLPYINLKYLYDHVEIDFYLDYFSNLDFTKLVKTQLTENLGLTGARKMSVVQQLNKNFATIKLEF